jgi:hypothetical protein
MANNPQKIQDPSEAALTAIQEALQVRDEPAPAADESPGPADPADAPPEVRHRASQAAPASAEDDDLFLDAAPAPGPRMSEQPSARPAANDDRESIGQVLQAIQRRPSRVSYSVAGLFTLGWLIAAGALTWLYLADLQALLAQGQTAVPILLVLSALVVLPIVFSFLLAQMVWRSQELRIIAQSMAEVAMRLAEPESAARESIVSVGQAIRREVAAMGDGVERALARAAELESLVHNEVSALERAYNDNEVRIRGLLQELAGQRDTLVEQAEQVRNAISSVHLDLSHDITAVSDLVAEKVNETAQRITRTLADRGEHITLALGHAGDSMISALTERGGDLLARLEHTSDNATRAITGASERLTTSLDFKTHNVHEEFAGLATNLTQMVASQLGGLAQDFEQRSTDVINTMESRTREMANAVTDSGARIADTVASRVEEVNNTLKATGDSLVLDLSTRSDEVVANLEQTGARITETIVTRSNKVAETFRDSAENIAQVIDSKGDSVKNMFSARLLAFEEMFTQGGAELGEKITRDSTSLGNLITRHLAEFDRTVKTYGGELVARLGDRTQEVAEAMRTYVDGFDDRVGVKTEELSGTLDQRLARFQEELDGRTQTLSTALSARMMDIATAMVDGGKDVIAALDKRITDVTGTINSRGAELADSIGAKIAEIDQTLGSRALDVANHLDTRIGRIEELNEAIKTNTGEAERTLTQLSNNVSGVLKQSADEAERALLGASAEVSRNFVGKADEIAAVVSQRAAEMTGILEANSGSLLSALAAKKDEFASQIGRATEHALQEIDSKGYVFTQSIIDSSSDIARNINEASVSATTAITRSLQEMQESAQAAIEQSKQTASATVSEMMETHGMLRSDTTTLFERLREANILLQEVLSGAHENMSSLENTMVIRAREFVSTMNELSEASGTASNQVEEHIGNFHNTTTRVLGDLSRLAVQFETHGRGLAEAVSLIDRSNQRTEQTLAERRTELDALVSTLDNRTGDLEDRLKRFTGSLDESLEAAAERARDIARLISDTSAGGAQSITEQFDLVRMTAEDERKRTADAMRAIYEEASSETNTVFRQTTERFTEVLHGMKHMAAEMQRELEATRVELRRGILELPQETAESTAQMRRVIVDQIEALAELNRIVARHGRGLDAAEPVRRENREESMISGTQRGEPMRGGPRDITSIAPARPRRAETPSLNPPSNGRGGWLTDLLHRASREEGEASADVPRETLREPERGDDRSPLHSIESLDSLSVDIARMIDHDAATELWDKYKRGERNVFTRRLYTLQGQKAFDEMRKKYRSDREFKQTVDRYISEFERLLEEVSRDDRGQVVARTYLTSETGKVYTMLAHAAGRFE